MTSCLTLIAKYTKANKPGHITICVCSKNTVKTHKMLHAIYSGLQMFILYNCERECAPLLHRIALQPKALYWSKSATPPPPPPPLIAPQYICHRD
uniref:Uncharacterized protein n=1 Tax=Glossina austeni TaxID=7395 RepID=A0A1A9VHJ8_GLOAU